MFLSSVLLNVGIRTYVFVISAVECWYENVMFLSSVLLKVGMRTYVFVIGAVKCWYNNVCFCHQCC